MRHHRLRSGDWGGWQCPNNPARTEDEWLASSLWSLRPLRHPLGSLERVQETTRDPRMTLILPELMGGLALAGSTGREAHEMVWGTKLTQEGTRSLGRARRGCPPRRR
jgi:hypothetical protein